MSRDLAMLVREVQRLTSEVEDLRGRVAAYERSRWMRLHPGLVVRRALPRSKARQVGGDGSAEMPETLDDPLVARFRHEVLERGAFTHDWFMHSIVLWERLLEELERRPNPHLLEIGSFEGLSASYMLWRLRNARVTCVDTFAGSVEYAVMDVDVSKLHDVFARNIALVDSSRARTIVGDSRRVMVDLIEAGERFDLVFIDGSHLALDVLVDAALSWQVLAEGGFLVFDDYRWKGVGADALLRPGPAIDLFLDLVHDKHEPIWKDASVAVRKTG